MHLDRRDPGAWMGTHRHLDPAMAAVERSCPAVVGQHGKPGSANGRALRCAVRRRPGGRCRPRGGGLKWRPQSSVSRSPTVSTSPIGRPSSSATVSPGQSPLSQSAGKASATSRAVERGRDRPEGLLQHVGHQPLQDGHVAKRGQDAGPGPTWQAFRLGDQRGLPPDLPAGGGAGQACRAIHSSRSPAPEKRRPPPWLWT